MGRLGKYEVLETLGQWAFGVVPKKFKLISCRKSFYEELELSVIG